MATKQRQRSYNAMEKIGQGGYQEVFLYKDIVIKIAESTTNSQAIKINEYLQELKSIGVNVPKYYGYHIINNQLFSFWGFTGKPLSQALLELNAKEVINIVKSIISLIKISNKEKIAFYPRIDQFTYQSKKVYFVDFYPTRLQSDFDNYKEDKKLALKDKLYSKEFRINKLIEEVTNIRPDLDKSLRLILCQK